MSPAGILLLLVVAGGRLVAESPLEYAGVPFSEVGPAIQLEGRPVHFAFLLTSDSPAVVEEAVRVRWGTLGRVEVLKSTAAEAVLSLSAGGSEAHPTLLIRRLALGTLPARVWIDERGHDVPPPLLRIDGPLLTSWLPASRSDETPTRFLIVERTRAETLDGVTKLANSVGYQVAPRASAATGPDLELALGKWPRISEYCDSVLRVE